jgi:hypothetical protein
MSGKRAGPYVYHDFDGRRSFRVIRKPDKTFPQESWDDERQEWVKGRNGTPDIPYNFPALIKAVDEGQTIYVVEGEKDVAAAREVGAVATCNPGGAGHWKDHLSTELVGAGEVIVVYDRDEAGYSHGWKLDASLKRMGVERVRFAHAREGKDLADHLDAGYGLDELVFEPPPVVDVGEGDGGAVAEGEPPPAMYQLVLAKLRERAAELRHKPPVEQADGNWKAICPAHEDKKPSLTVRLGDEKAVVINCFAGCEPKAVVEALGIPWPEFAGATRHVKPSGRLVTRKPSLDRVRPIRSVWDKRVLAGYLNLLVGEEGIGKGNLVAWMAARVSRGELPGDVYGEPRSVLFIGDEDSWDNVWTPRFYVAGADFDYIEQLDVENDDGVLDVHRDSELIGEAIEETGAVLVYFDQLLDNLGAADNWKDKDIRHALRPIRKVARETDCAALATLHPRKNVKGNFRDLVSGTSQFNAVSRSSLYVTGHPYARERVIVVRPKGNYTKEPRAFEFEVEEQTPEIDGREITTSRITSERESALTWRDVFEARTDTEAATLASEARALLMNTFADGKERPAAGIIEAAKADGIPERTLQRARKELGLHNWREGFQGPWIWGPVPKASRARGQSPGED